MEVFSNSGMEEMGINLKDSFSHLFPKKKQRRRVPISQARDLLIQQECESLVDREKVIREALDRVQTSGIIFLDEIDKVAGRKSSSHGPDVSREGVQRIFSRLWKDQPSTRSMAWSKRIIFCLSLPALFTSPRSAT